MLEKAKLADTCRLRGCRSSSRHTDEGAWVYLLLRQYQIPYRVFPDKMKLARILQRERKATRLYPPGTLASVRQRCAARVYTGCPSIGGTVEEQLTLRGKTRNRK